jgi:hypothetical protein
VGHEQKGRLGAVAAQAGDDRRAVRRRPDDLAVDPVSGEDVTEVVRGDDLVPRRVTRVEAEQGLEVREDFVAGGVQIIGFNCHAGHRVLAAFDAPRAINHSPSSRYPGERAGERGQLRARSKRAFHRERFNFRALADSTRRSPLSPTLSPEYREEGVRIT